MKCCHNKTLKDRNSWNICEIIVFIAVWDVMNWRKLSSWNWRCFCVDCKAVFVSPGRHPDGPVRAVLAGGPGEPEAGPGCRCSGRHHGRRTSCPASVLAAAFCPCPQWNSCHCHSVKLLLCFQELREDMPSILADVFSILGTFLVSCRLLFLTCQVQL